IIIQIVVDQQLEPVLKALVKCLVPQLLLLQADLNLNLCKDYWLLVHYLLLIVQLVMLFSKPQKDTLASFLNSKQILLSLLVLGVSFILTAVIISYHEKTKFAFATLP